MVERGATHRKGINMGHYHISSVISSVQMQTPRTPPKFLAGYPSLFSAVEAPLLV